MEKLIKNWIFTLVTTILLTALGVIMLLGGFDVWGFPKQILHLLVAIALIIYVAFALCPLMFRYRGVLRGFAIGEVTVLLLLAFVEAYTQFETIPFLPFKGAQVCEVIGFAIWMRGVVETVHAYLSNAYVPPKSDETSTAAKKKRIPLWQLCLYILLSAVGMWQVANPLISDAAFIFIVAAISFVIAIIFGYITVQNRKACPKREKKPKKAKAVKATVAVEAETLGTGEKVSAAQQQEEQQTAVPAVREEKAAVSTGTPKKPAKKATAAGDAAPKKATPKKSGTSGGAAPKTAAKKAAAPKKTSAEEPQETVAAEPVREEK